MKRFIRENVKEIVVFGIFIVSLSVFFIGSAFAALTPTKSVIITSKNTSFENSEEGSWQVTKSGEWTAKGEATVSFDVDTTLMTNNQYTDIIFVLDISGSMSGEKLERVKSDSTELINTLLSNSNNRAALITFDTDSSILSRFTNDREALTSQISELSVTGSTNYYQALVNVDTILQDYTKEEGRELIVLFLTDGYPNVDTPNQIAEYGYLKDQYPYANINGIQYEMGNTILNPIVEISDNQFIADMETLNNVLFDASVAPIPYEEFQIVDYVNNDYFLLNSEDDIKVSQGSVELTEEDGIQKITWTIDNLKSGSNANLTMKLQLKEEFIGQGGIYPTNDREEIISKIENQAEDVNSTLTPILADNYRVIYEGNNPEGCSVTNIPETINYSVFDTVAIIEEEPTCTGYEFRGWEIATDDVTRVNDDYFIMPEKDVTIRATWSKTSLAKSMDGTVSNVMTLYKVMQDQAVMDNVTSEFVSSSTGIRFNSISSNTNGKGVYERAGTENNEYPIYYYRGDVDNNHVKFAGFCWKAVRTTETGGVKLIYDGEPDSNGYCNNTGEESSIGDSAFNSSYSSPADVGYMYGTRYTYSSKSVDWYALIGKSRTYLSGMSSKTYYYSDSVSYDSSTGEYTLVDAEALSWSDNYNDLEGSYTCRSETDTSCTSVRYLDSTSSSSMYYVTMENGETYDSLIEEANQLTWVYGNDVTWNGSEYTLVDTVESKPMEWSTDRTSVVGNGHRYTCLSDSNTCNTVYYVHYTGTTNYVYYMTLKDGKNISDALNEMFPDDNNLRNQTDSTIKKKIDEWYETNMVDYTKYLEDTVWCNDRSIYQLNSWDKDYSGTGYLYFGPYGRAYSSYNPTTTCSNINDSFTVSSEKGNGKLTYPVALLTADEIMLAGGRGGYSNSSYYLYTGQTWWSLSPYYYNGYYAFGFIVYSAGSLNYNNVGLTYGVRPSVSLAPGIMVVNGDGSSEMPYEVMLEDEVYG